MVTDAQLDDIVQAAVWTRDHSADWVRDPGRLASMVARAEATLALVAEVRAMRAALAAPEEAYR